MECQYFRTKEGIGGHCLPKDTKMFLESSKSRTSKILTAALEMDEDYKKYRQRQGEASQLVSPMIRDISVLEK